MLTIGAIALSRNRATTKALVCVLLIAGVLYLLTPLIARANIGYLAPTLQLLPEILPALLLLLVLIVFEERSVQTGVWLLMAVMAMLAIAMQASQALALQTPVWLRLTLHLFKAAFVIAAIVLLWRGRKDDLSAARRQLRPIVGWMMAIAAAGVIGVELLYAWQIPAAIELIGMAGMFAAGIAANLRLLNWNPELEPAVVPAPDTSAAVASTDNPRLAALLHAMRDDRAYADHDLRIAGLAKNLGTSEGQLRALINANLGFRNFNQFVNSYRIDEAAERLIKQPGLPVLTIALDVGFRSLSSFNSAFKATKGCTPTQWRAGDAPRAHENP